MRFAFITKHRHIWPVSWLCEVLEVSRSGFHAWLNRPLSDRAILDAKLVTAIDTSFKASDRTYGARRVWHDVLEEGLICGLHRIERLMRQNALKARPKRRRKPQDDGECSVIADNVLDRDFEADRPNQKWLADFTYIWTAQGWLYVAVVLDLFSRRVVGWQLSKSLRTDLALDALEMGIWTRDHAGQAVSGLTHHSDKGVQYVAIRYTERLAEAGAAASVGSTGDSYDNALAEAFNSLFKAELVRNRGPWKNIDDLEIATAEYIDWFNHRRLHGEIGMIPPVELEDTYHHNHPAPAPADAALASL